MMSNDVGPRCRLLCTDYYSRIDLCTELDYYEPNFIFHFSSFIFVVIYMYCVLCIAAY